MAEDKQRIALVTGGMGGLGEAICAKLAAGHVTAHRDPFVDGQQVARQVIRF